MSNTLILKRSATPNAVPTAGQLTYGELAINYLDGNLFYKNSSDQVVVIASNQFVSVSGNVTGGNIITVGQVTATGNVTGSYLLGNGAFITGINTGDSFDTVVVAGQSNLVANASGVLNIAATGSTNGTTITTDPSTGTLNISSITGDLIFQSGSYAGLGSVTGPATALNDLGTVNDTTNDQYDLGTFFYDGAYIDNTWLYPNSITGDKLNSSTSISLTGNITGNYILGNGALLTGVITSVANINSGSSNVAITTPGGNVSVTVGGIANVAVFSTDTLTLTSNLVPSANVTYSLGTASARWKDLYLAGNSIYLGNIQLTDSGNIFVSPNMSAQGNVIAGGIVSATGNVVGGNIIGGTLVQGTNFSASGIVSATGNITGANINASGIISAAGNITGGNLISVGTTTSTGNIQTANSMVYANAAGAPKVYQYYNAATNSLDTVFV